MIPAFEQGADMALTHIAFCTVGVSGFGGSIPVADSEEVVCEGITPSGSNQQSAASTRSFVRVSTDTAVYIATGADPNALTSTTARFYMPANSVEYFQIEKGNKVAVVNA